jgi:hypothetical protein
VPLTSCHHGQPMLTEPRELSRGLVHFAAHHGGDPSGQGFGGAISFRSRRACWADPAEIICTSDARDSWSPAIEDDVDLLLLCHRSYGCRGAGPPRSADWTPDSSRCDGMGRSAPTMRHHRLCVPAIPPVGFGARPRLWLHLSDHVDGPSSCPTLASISVEPDRPTGRLHPSELGERDSAGRKTRLTPVSRCRHGSNPLRAAQWAWLRWATGDRPSRSIHHRSLSRPLFIDRKQRFPSVDQSVNMAETIDSGRPGRAEGGGH